MALNILIFFGSYELRSDPQMLSLHYTSYGIVPAQFTASGELSPLFSSMFLHGGLMHLAGNMLFLWIFGDNLEDAMGHAIFLGFYLLSGVAAGLAQVAAAPYSPIPIVGASGAIAGVMGGYLLLYPRAKVDILVLIIFYIRIVSIPAWVMLGLWFAFQIFNGGTDGGSGGGVAYWAHAGGFVVGFILCLPFWLKRGGTAGWAKSAGRPNHPRARYRVAKTNIPRVARRRRRIGPWG